MKIRLLSVLLVLTLLLGAALPAFAVTDEEPQISRCELYAESNLTRMGYSDLANRTELAVGDTLEVLYEDSLPATVYVNGEAVAQLAAGDRQFYFLRLEEAGAVEIAVRREDITLLAQRFTVIASAEMYRKTLREALSSLDLRVLFDSIGEEPAPGFPYGNPFLPLAAAVTLLVNVANLLFAVTRIVR